MNADLYAIIKVHRINSDFLQMFFFSRQKTEAKVATENDQFSDIVQQSHIVTAIRAVVV